VRNYNWGYNTVHYFAPEASYGRQPLKGSQYYEHKTMVNELHRRGFGVIMDVVYNHVGGPNLFSLIDKKYFFRLTPDYKFINFSACGNDVKTESPMMRKFIVDNCVYWVKEHHVDGFRFDLAELVDNKTLLAVRDAVWAINSNVVLIAEPWSIRAQNKEQLTGTGWAAWNNDFRYASKDFARGKANRDWMKYIITGSTEIWTANPMQAVNYAESHDDMALVDELSLRPDRNGKYVQSYEVAMNKLVATLIFTSLGIPMIHEGQDFLRSKYGIQNTYNKGDAVNAVRWTDREQPLAKENSSYYRDLIAMRKSDQGRAFRVREKAPEATTSGSPPKIRAPWATSSTHPASTPAMAFVALLNAADEAVEFSFTLPEGRWRVIGDHVKRGPGRPARTRGGERRPDGQGAGQGNELPPPDGWVLAGMKYLDEYRDAEAARQLADAIARITTRPWVLMEVCGGQTHAIVKFGIDELLPNGRQLIHGPGCPVCVTSLELIDKAIAIAQPGPGSSSPPSATCCACPARSGPACQSRPPATTCASYTPRWTR
jgi:pullulanase/glycogen debranching enzyme